VNRRVDLVDVAQVGFHELYRRDGAFANAARLFDGGSLEDGVHGDHSNQVTEAGPVAPVYT